MRNPRFAKGPWKSTFTFGNGQYRILSSRGYIASVESPDDARLIKCAPILYETLDTVAQDVRRMLDRYDTIILESDRAWLEQAVRRIDGLLNEVDGK